MRPLVLSLTALFALSAPALSARADDFWGADVEVMADGDLAEHRGGIAVRPGLDVNFGVMVTTFVNGAPALTTNLTWNETGQFVDQTVGQIGQRIDDLSPEQRSALGIDGLAGAGGVVIADANGVTALVHNVSEGALQNIILNTASGRDLRQDVDVTLTLPGFEAVQQSLSQERTGIRIQGELQGVAF